MSSYYVVSIQAPVAPEHLVEAHASGPLFLNARGRPCEAVRAARLESEDLARALLDACAEPLRARYGEDLRMRIEAASGEGSDDAQRVANDSNATRDWLVSQPTPG